MGLKKSTFTNLAKSIFSIGGDAIKQGVYHQKGVQVYNSKTRKMEYQDKLNFSDGSIGDETIDHPIKVFEATYSSHKIDGDRIRVDDRNFIIIQDELKTTPQRNESITVDNITFRIVAIERDAIAALWILQCRI